MLQFQDLWDQNATLILTFAAISLTAFIYLWKSQSKPEELLSKTEFRDFKLIKKDVITHNTAIYQFELPSKRGLNLPIGQHVSVRALCDGKEVTRSYTPTSLSDDVGHFDLLIKSYPTGNISKYFTTLKVGDMVSMRGPKGNFLYRENMCRAIGMVAGGTGITPMLQIIQSVLRNSKDRTVISLLFGNVAEEDILLRDQLNELEKKHSTQFHVYHVLNNPPAGWTGGTGFVTVEMMRQHLPPPAADIKILLCGPPPMVKAMQVSCVELGYDPAKPISKIEDQVFKF